MSGTDRLAVLRGAARDWAGGLRDRALADEADPLALPRSDGPAARYFAAATLPRPLHPGPLRLGRHEYFGSSCAELAVVMEELAVGDPGAVFGAPGAALAGSIVTDLADAAQRKRFYQRLADRPQWTFAAVTEPGHGSNVTGLRAALTPRPAGGWTLSGTKRYIGNGARAAVGVVFARTGDGPLGLSAVLLDTAATGFTARPLPMIGLRGAGLSELTFDAVEVAAGDLLGAHLPASRSGLWSALRMFNRARPLVAAAALGVAQATRAYLTGQQGRPRAAERVLLEQFDRRLAATRLLVHRAAAAVDHDPRYGYLGSAAKVRAVALAEDLTLAAPGLLGPGARLDHPLLDKFARDARGFELMEGTTTMQKLNLFHGLRHGDLVRR